MSTVATDLQALVGAAFADARRLERAETQLAVESVIDGLDRGEIRLAQKSGGAWVVNAWVQQAILLYFRLRQMLENNEQQSTAEQWRATLERLGGPIPLLTLVLTAFAAFIIVAVLFYSYVF